MTDLKKYGDLIQKYAAEHYKDLFREPAGLLKYPFIVPGAGYQKELWDWDSWLTDVGISDIAEEDISAYEKGCVLNFLDHVESDGWTPTVITAKKKMPPFRTDKRTPNTNTHKPCLCQHALFIAEKYNDVNWLKPYADALERYLSFFAKNCFHAETGIYIFLDDSAIGIDNDPAVFGRPEKSTASVYLNCLMYKELEAAEKLFALLYSDNEKSARGNFYREKKEALGNAVRELLWDERDGFFYSADVNLVPHDSARFLHSGAPRHWDFLLMRIDSFAGILPLWAGIATKEQAERAKAHILDERTFSAKYGIRTLSRLEKMFCEKQSSNPSCWLGPVWIIAEYMIVEGFLNYGFEKEARELAEKVITLVGQDIERCGEMHEYYSADTGEGLSNQGFMSWNLLLGKLV